MKECITIQTKKDKVTMKIDMQAEQKQILQELKKKVTELKKLQKLRNEKLCCV